MSSQAEKSTGGSKIVTPKEAVSKFIKDGDIVAAGGFSITRKSYAIFYEMARQRKKDIHLVYVTPGGPDEVLAAAGCLAGITGCYMGDELVQVIHPLCSRLVKENKIFHEDYSHYSLIIRFKAAAMGVPFLPTHSQLGSDLVNPDYDVERLMGRRGKDNRYALEKFKTVEDPFWPEHQKVCLLPALIPDVSVIHAQIVGEKGTVRINGPLGGDVEQAYAGKKLIVTCDEVVSEDYMAQNPQANTLPHYIVDAIVPVPFAAHPGSSYGNYDYDAAFLREYHTAMGDDTRRDKWMDEWVYGVKDHWEYLDKLGVYKLSQLKADPQFQYNPLNDRSAYQKNKSEKLKED